MAEDQPAPVNLGGRPKLFESDDELRTLVNEYLTECHNNKRRPTISGLAFTLGMTTETLRQYGKDEKFSATIKSAKQIVEMSWEDRLADGSCTGAIFWLKNNAGWKDQKETALTGAEGKDLIPEIDETTLARRIAFTLIKAAKEEST